MGYDNGIGFRTIICFTPSFGLNSGLMHCYQDRIIARDNRFRAAARLCVTQMHLRVPLYFPAFIEMVIPVALNGLRDRHGVDVRGNLLVSDIESVEMRTRLRELR
jgi:hypothetical protein